MLNLFPPPSRKEIYVTTQVPGGQEQPCLPGLSSKNRSHPNLAGLSFGSAAQEAKCVLRPGSPRSLEAASYVTVGKSLPLEAQFPQLGNGMFRKLLWGEKGRWLFYLTFKNGFLLLNMCMCFHV